MTAGGTQTPQDHASTRELAVVVDQPHLVVALSAQKPLAGGARASLVGVDEVRIGRGLSQRFVRRREENNVLDVELSAPAVSSRHARLVRGRDGTWDVIDLGSRNGVFLNGERIESGTLSTGDVLEIGQVFFYYDAHLPTPIGAESDVAVDPSSKPAGLGTLMPHQAARFEALADVAASKVPVLLLGETGTGKELLARAVHELSGRTGRFVAVNAGALPSALVEALLFGHAKGAFSGAVREELGFVRASDGGTLFLDEIGDLPPSSQAALLRVLQEAEVVPVGSTRAVPVDLRVVSATHRPLDSLVEDGRFRADLLARLRGYTHALPALRDRRADIGLMIGTLLARVAGPRAGSMTLHPKAVRALFRHDWPHNVRELEQCLAAAVVLAKDGVITLEHLPDGLRSPPPGVATPPAPSRLSDEDKALRDELTGHLTEQRGNIAAVARAMGKAPVQIHRWMKRWGVDPNRYR